MFLRMIPPPPSRITITGNTTFRFDQKFKAHQQHGPYDLNVQSTKKYQHFSFSPTYFNEQWMDF